MSEIISKYIKPINSEIESINTIINDMVFPSIQMFCEIPVYYDKCSAYYALIRKLQ